MAERKFLADKRWETMENRMIFVFFIVKKIPGHLELAQITVFRFSRLQKVEKQKILVENRGDWMVTHVDSFI